MAMSSGHVERSDMLLLRASWRPLVGPPPAIALQIAFRGPSVCAYGWVAEYSQKPRQKPRRGPQQGLRGV